MTSNSQQPFTEFSLSRLDAFLRDTLPGARGEMQLERIGGGQSNPTFFVSYANRQLVLRKKPAGDILPSAHAVDREYRVISALANSDVPVPKALLFHGDDDVVGTPFYVMERLHGRVFADYQLAQAPAGDRWAMYQSMAHTLASLHKVDIEAVGLSDFGRNGNYFSRQLNRWGNQWEAAEQAHNPYITPLLHWLRAHVPADTTTRLCHGDFRMGNLMFHPTEPRVIGVLDWELSTLGHPLADLAYNCIAWETLPEEYGGIRGLDLSALGIAELPQYLALYYQQVPEQGMAEPFHFAFALFRLAVIFEGIAARARLGTAASANASDVSHLGTAFARRGLALLDLL